MDEARTIEVCVVGAGFAGLHVARLLDDAGIDYLVLDKGRSPGGRAATRRMGEARVDHGLPWLTGTGGLTDVLIDRFREDGLVKPLFVGGSVGDAWVAPAGISSLMKNQAVGINVRLSHQVRSVTAGTEGGPWLLRITNESGDPYQLAARHVVITAPIPQAVEIAPAIAESLGGADPGGAYRKAVIGLARLSPDIAISGPVLVENPAEGIERVIIESAKFPNRPPSISIRCDDETSDLLWDVEDAEAWRWLASRTGELAFLESEPEEAQIKRWRFSEVAHPVGKPFLTAGTGEASISACGDSFDAGGSTGVEAALRSAQALCEASPW